MSSALKLRSQYERSRDSLALELVDHEGLRELTTGLVRSAEALQDLKVAGLPDGDRYRASAEMRKGQYGQLRAIISGDRRLAQKVIDYGTVDSPLGDSGTALIRYYVEDREGLEPLEFGITVRRGYEAGRVCHGSDLALEFCTWEAAQQEGGGSSVNGLVGVALFFDRAGAIVDSKSLTYLGAVPHYSETLPIGRDLIPSAREVEHNHLVVDLALKTLE